MQTLKGLSKSLHMMGKRLPLYLLAIFLMTAFNALFEVAGSFFMQIVFDTAERGFVGNALQTISVTVLLGIIAIALASVFMCVYNNEAKKMTLTLKEKVFAKSMRFPYAYYEENHSAQLLSKMIYDTDVASNIYSSRLRRVLAPIIFVIVFAVAMIIINPAMTSVLISLNILMFVANTLLSNPMKRIGKQLSKVNENMTNQLSNMIAGAGITKIYDVVHIGVTKYKSHSQAYYKTQKKRMGLLAVLEMFNTAFDLLCSLMFVVVGILFVQKQMATIGEIAAIYTLYTSLSFRFLQLGKNFPELVNCIAYMDRIIAYLELPEEQYLQGENTQVTNSDKEKSIASNECLNAVVFEQITFGYPNKELLFENYTYKIPSNDTTALTGASGFGKSTLAKLLLGFYDLQAGAIYIFGQNIKDIGKIAARAQIAYVPQVPYLYEVSVMENIRYGNINATDTQVIEAAKLANAHDFIQQLENGYDTILMNQGNNISGGQRQRIAIARAILKDVPIILMDEATSALDNESEQLISKAINTIGKEKTVISIAHRRGMVGK